MPFGRKSPSSGTNAPLTGIGFLRSELSDGTKAISSRAGWEFMMELQVAPKPSFCFKLERDCGGVASTNVPASVRDLVCLANSSVPISTAIEVRR
ncbi:hypothetical protein SAMN05444164_6975 [Bradyrhizobium erythrophlei]|uniref:Uncharacterized protein n=1 Tax=Bradyrhizobium erythrophlei TaxID=1437360 RepID=A0A1H5G8I5_9BRAD|nr:hypothetical protein SAMN05444164_6975 [Bradyrhizobium erythrophlei]